MPNEKAPNIAVETQASNRNAHEVLSGAGAIALHLFGDRKYRRKVYYLAERHALPVFRIGANICARKLALAEWITWKEKSVALSDLLPPP